MKLKIGRNQISIPPSSGEAGGGQPMAALINDNLATKRDLKELEIGFLLKIGGMLAATIAILATLIKLIS